MKIKEFEMWIDFEKGYVVPKIEKGKWGIDVKIDNMFSNKEITQAVRKCLILNNLIDFQNGITMKVKT